MNGWGEMSVEDSGENYLLKYREGRFNPSVIEGGEFEILDNAVEFGDKIAGGDWEIDTDPVWHRSKLCLEKDGYSINVYENDTEQDYVVLTATESRGVDELKSGYVGEEVEMAEYVGELLDYVEIRERSGEEAAEISEFFRNF